MSNAVLTRPAAVGAGPEPERAGPTARRFPARLLLGLQGDPVWARPALWALLLVTGALYLWRLDASGTANSFYAAAVQAGSQSWKAMLFGSSDAGNAITVDKPAASLWPMVLAARIFGFSSWSMLVPQALEGVATVALTYATVRRVTTHAWALLAGALVAVTPVAVLMFKFNNPDALLVLLLAAACYATVRALPSRGGLWLALAGAFVGLGFITKMGQALLVVPAIGLTYLLFATAPIWRRLLHLALAGLAAVAGAGWWISVVELWPASSRPYIGGSTTNSILELALGYNGLGRLLGNSAGNGGGGDGGGMGSFGGATGITRLFRSEMATEISWLLPAALLLLVAGLALTWRAPRTDLRRAVLVLSGLVLLTTAAVFSFMQGTIHPYYTVALAAPIASTLALGASILWDRRDGWSARAVAAVAVMVTAVWDIHLLASTPDYVAWLRPVLFVAAAVAVLGLLLGPWLRKLAVVGLLAALLVGFGGSCAYAVATANTGHTGSIPSAGPVATSSFGGGPGGTGGEAGTASGELTALLSRTTSRWAAATNGSMSAAPLQLASSRPVLGIGGFSGGDDAPTLARFIAWVQAGDIAYYVSGGGLGGGPGGGGSASEISAWVQANYPATTVGSSTVYDLTNPTS